MTDLAAPPTALDRLLPGAVIAVVVGALGVHGVWWWLRRYDWSGDYQGTYEGLHDDIDDFWFFSVEVGCLVVVVIIAAVTAAVGVRSPRRRARRLAVGFLVTTLVALANMVSFRLLLPSLEDSTLPNRTSEDCCGSPTREIAVVDDAVDRSVVLGAAIVIGATVISARAARDGR